jgi:hypothetical protein
MTLFGTTSPKLANNGLQMIKTANSYQEEGKVTSQRPDDRLSALPESPAYWGLLAVAGYSLLRSVVYAAIKPFWFDEVLTFVVSRQGAPSTIWAALKQGVDGNPPTFYLLEHFVASLLRNEHIGYRLLSIAGFVCALLFLFVFLKTRCGSHSSLLCSSLLLITPLFTLYAEEARPYSLVAALIALAMVCYQRIPGIVWTVGLGASLLIAALLHYYTVLALAPFFLAELALVYFARQIRFKVWLALALPLVPIAVSWPRLMWMKQNWGAHFWAGAALSDVSATYGAYFRVGPPWGIAICVLTIMIILLPLFRRFSANDESLLQPALIAERVLIAGLIALPLIGFAVAKIAHGPFVERYFLPSIFGFATGAALVLRSAPAKTLLAAAILVFVALSSQEVGFWKGLKSRETVASMTAPLTKLADNSNFLDLPIVLSDSGYFVEIWHYAPAAIFRRAVTLPDPESAVTYTGIDTVDKLVLALRPYGPPGIQDFASFRAAHPRFLLYSDGSRFDWLATRLAHDGYRVERLSWDLGGAAYLVEAPHSREPSTTYSLPASTVPLRNLTVKSAAP